MFFLSTIVFYAAGYMLLPTLPIILAGRGGSPFDVGLVMGSFTAASLLFRIPVARQLAKRSPVPLLRFGQAALGVGFVAYLALPGLFPMLAGRIIQGIGLAAFNTAAYVYLSEMGGLSRRAEFISLFGLSANVAMALAPAAGALLLQQHGETGLFVTCAALAVVGLFTIPRVEGYPLGGEAQLWERRAVLPSVAMLGLAVAYGTVMVFVPLAMHHHGLTNGWLFFSVYSVGIILTRLGTRRGLDRGHRLHWTYGGAAFIVLGLGLLAVAQHWMVFGAAAVLFGIGIGTGHPSLMAYIMETVPPSRRAGATAMATSAFDAGTAGGAAVAGFIAEYMGFSTAFVAVAGVFVLLLVPLALKAQWNSRGL